MFQYGYNKLMKNRNILRSMLDPEFLGVAFLASPNLQRDIDYINEDIKHKKLDTLSFSEDRMNNLLKKQLELEMIIMYIHCLVNMKPLRAQKYMFKFCGFRSKSCENGAIVYGRYFMSIGRRSGAEICFGELKLQD